MSDHQFQTTSTSTAAATSQAVIDLHHTLAIGGAVFLIEVALAVVLFLGLHVEWPPSDFVTAVLIVLPIGVPAGFLLSTSITHLRAHGRRLDHELIDPKLVSAIEDERDRLLDEVESLKLRIKHAPKEAIVRFIFANSGSAAIEITALDYPYFVAFVLGAWDNPKRTRLQWIPLLKSTDEGNGTARNRYDLFRRVLANAKCWSGEPLGTLPRVCEKFSIPLPDWYQPPETSGASVAARPPMPERGNSRVGEGGEE